MVGFKLQRLGMIMEPEPGNPQEVEGVLNPAATRGPDGKQYLFPRLVAKGNYSRIGIARVRFNEAGDPAGVERLGIALEPEADYELQPGGKGGCEDPRITFVEPLRRYVGTYAAFSARGPRIAFAVSEDLFHWKRLGLANFGPNQGIEFADVDDKDASLFPVAIPNPSGHPELAILHRPLFPGTRPEETARHPASREVDLERESIWISYCQTPLDGREPRCLGKFTSHHRLATPVSPLQRLEARAMPANTGDQAAADLLCKRYRRYLEASGQPFKDKPRIDLGGARTIAEILNLRFRRSFAPNPAKPE
jgi:beta-1,2-mannobiose phosphorylase / 1,2-beta-oligomannan phosphorylase